MSPSPLGGGRISRSCLDEGTWALDSVSVLPSGLVYSPEWVLSSAGPESTTSTAGPFWGLSPAAPLGDLKDGARGQGAHTRGT